MFSGITHIFNNVTQGAAHMGKLQLSVFLHVFIPKGEPS